MAVADADREEPPDLRARLTKRTVEAVTPGDKDIYVRDTEIRGFALKVTPAGARIYVQSYRAGGRRGWLTHGRHGDISAEQARQLALSARAKIAAGENPQADRAGEAGPTVAQLAERYISEYATPFKRPRSVEEDKRNLKLHVLPALGRTPVSDITRQDVLKLHHRQRATPATANRVLALTSKMFSMAVEWGMIADSAHPARKIRKFPEVKRERFLSSDEIRRLGAVLGEMDRVGLHRREIAIVRLLLLTGARLSEIRTLEWAFIDFERGTARLAESKTGAKTLRFPAAALDVLARIPRGESRFVFPDRGGDRPIYRSAAERVWDEIRERGDLSGVRLHDLRHSFASVAASGGMSLPIIGSLLGHARPGTTARYAHLERDALQEAAERVGSTLAAALVGGTAEIAKLPIARSRK